MVLEAVVYLVIGLTRAVWWILVQFVRLPSLALGATAMTAAGLRFGWLGVYVTVGVLLSGLLAWRFGAPASFDRWARPRLLTMVRAAEHRVRWPRVARRAALVVHDWSNGRASRPEAVTLLKVQVTPSGVERLHLRLPVGLSPADAVDKVDAIAHALKCRDAKVCTDRPGRVVLELRRKDTLATVVAPMMVPETLNLAAVPAGRSEDGDPWCIRLAGTHLLLAGATGSGKSSVLWSLLRALSVGVRDRLVEVWAVDPKGGMELHPRVAMAILRHSKIAVTMDIYSQVSAASTKEALKRLGEAFG